MAREYESYSENELLDLRRRFEDEYRGAQREYEQHVRRHGSGGAGLEELAEKMSNWRRFIRNIDSELALRRSDR